MRRLLIPVLLLVLLLPACASSKGFIVSGETLDATGRQFVAVGNLYNRLLDGGHISADQYRPWAKFATKFKVAYPRAVDLWKDAIKFNDLMLAKQSENAIMVLVQELTDLATFVYTEATTKGVK